MSASQFSGHQYPAMLSPYDSDESDSEDEFSGDHDYNMPLIRNGSKKYVNKGRWTKEEDDKLKNIVDTYGMHNWPMIAGYFPDRTDIQCQHRWQKVLNPELIKGPWTKEEDDKVLMLVKQYGPKRWTLISKHLKGRTGKQCRERWHNHLNPEIKKCAWTEDEDRMIYQIHKRLGNKWAEIAKYLPGRTDNAIKNHWNSTMRRKYEQEEEQEKLKALQAGVQPPDHFMNYQNTVLNQTNTNNMPNPVNFGPVYATPSHTNFNDLQQVRLFDNITPQTPSSHLIQRTGPGSVVVHRNAPQSQPNNGNTGYSNYGDSDWGPLATPPECTPQPADVPSIPDPTPQPSRPTPSPSEQITSPRRWHVNQNGILSPLKYVPDVGVDQLFPDEGPTADLGIYDYNFLCGSDSNSNSRSPYKFTAIHSKESTEYRFDGKAISGLQDAPSGLIPLTSEVIASKLSTPPILRKSKRKRKSVRSNDPLLIKPEPESSDTDRDTTLLHTPKGPSIVPKDEPRTPEGSPIKGLPFSPSQFLNSPEIPFGRSLTSTPVCRETQNTTPIQQRHLGTPLVKNERGECKSSFRTPRIRRSILDATPRTPTPFKNALAELEKKNGALKPMSPNRVDDLTKVIEEDSGGMTFSSYKTNFSPAPTRGIKRPLQKENRSPKLKKARKSLDRKWSTPGDLNLGDSLILPETPSKSLIGDQSIVFSPPSIIKETLHEEKSFSLNDAFTLPNTPRVKPDKYDTKWEEVACGKSQVQMEMTAQAKQWFTNTHLKPRSLKL